MIALEKLIRLLNSMMFLHYLVPNADCRGWRGRPACTDLFSTYERATGCARRVRPLLVPWDWNCPLRERQLNFPRHVIWMPRCPPPPLFSCTLRRAFGVFLSSDDDAISCPYVLNRRGDEGEGEGIEAVVRFGKAIAGHPKVCAAWAGSTG